MSARHTLAAAIAAVLLSPFAHAESTLPNGVAAGDATAHSAMLWTRTTAPGLIRFEVSSRPTFEPARVVTRTAVDAMLPVKVAIHELRPGMRYFYRVTDAAGTTARGEFKTPAVGERHLGLRFGVSGDARGDNAPYYGALNVAGRKLDFLVNLGDTIYADIESPALPGVDQARTTEEFRAKHAEVYSERDGVNALAAARASTTLYATIDDHEVTNDFAGGADSASDVRFDGGFPYINETALYQTGLQAFQDYNPLADRYYGETGDARTAHKRKLYRYRQFGGDAAILIADARSFRDQGLAPANLANPADVFRFLGQSFDPGRTLLGRAQVDDIKRDLLKAQAEGVTWKFVFIPEPIQNLGVLAASDRYEGYAAERTELLEHINENHIQNVVFVSADIHGTLVNNLTYQEGPGLPQIPTKTFEITTGAWAFDAPFGPTVAGLAHQLGLIGDAQYGYYNSLPTPAKEVFIQGLVNAQLAPMGYDPLGLEGSPIDVQLLQGGYQATHTYGWSEFQIDPTTQELLVTTYGVEPGVKAAPTVVGQFKVKPEAVAESK